jgi:hypothetical protein
MPSGELSEPTSQVSAMPKISVAEDHHLRASKDDVGSARQARRSEAVSITPSKDFAPQYHLATSVSFCACGASNPGSCC